MSRKGVLITALIFMLAVSIAVNILLLWPDEEQQERTFECTSMTVTSEGVFYFPEEDNYTGMTVIYDGEDITSHCYIQILDAQHVNVIFDRAIDLSKLQFKL